MQTNVGELPLQPPKTEDGEDLRVKITELKSSEGRLHFILDGVHLGSVWLPPPSAGNLLTAAALPRTGSPTRCDEQ